MSFDFETALTKKLTQELEAEGYFGTVLTAGVVVNPYTYQPEITFFFRFPQGKTYRTPIKIGVEIGQDCEQSDETIKILVAEFKSFLQPIIDRMDKPVVIKRRDWEDELLDVLKKPE